MKTIRCERCDEVLNPDRVVTLELSNTDGKYYLVLPIDHVSQGGFDFGKACSLSQLKEDHPWMKGSKFMTSMVKNSIKKKL